MAEAEQGPSLEYRVAPELEGGAYANFLVVTYSAYEFTFDFGVLHADDPMSERPDEVVPFRVTARIRWPVALLFEVIRTMNEALTAYERRFGEIRPPEDRAE